MDGLVDLVVIDAFLAYHHNKESLVVAMLVNAYDTLTEDARRVEQGLSVAHPLCMYGWFLTFFAMKVDMHVPYKVTACVPRKGKQIGSSSWLVR